MFKKDIEKIIEYKKFKEDYLYKNGSLESLDAKEKYSAYEESVYGKSLCTIYSLMNKIELGRKYLINIFTTFILLLLTTTHNYINVVFLDINTTNTAFKYSFGLSICLLIVLLYKLIMINKYNLFIAYKLQKLITKN